MPRYCLLAFFILLASAGRAQDVESVDIATSHKIKKGESIYKIARFFDLGMDEIMRANPEIENQEIIQAGKTIILPTTHLLPDAKKEGIVINLAEPRLYFFFDSQVFSFPISIGADEKTPIGKTKIVNKVEKPSWTPPKSIREENPKLPEVVPPGPDNPLGNYALRLDGSKNYKWQSILIHGTNAPWSVGSKVSHGCIRLYPEDIERLFGVVEIGTSVRIINQPIKVAEADSKIYIEVHLPEVPDVALEKLGAGKLICKKIKDCERKVDWQKVDEAVTQDLGIPVDVTNDQL